MTPIKASQFIRNTRWGAALVAVGAVLIFSAIPVYFALGHDRDHKVFLTSEAKRHLDSRLVHAQALLDRAKSIPSIVALTLSQASSHGRFETAIRDVLGMSGIVESVSVASGRAVATVIHRDPRDQTKPADLPIRPTSALAMDKRPFIGFGEDALLIRETLSEVGTDGTRRFWGFVTAEASIADLIQEMHLRALVKDGFGVHLAVEWQSAAGETVIFDGGTIADKSAAAVGSLPLAGNAVLTLTVAPPEVLLAGLPPRSILGILLADIVLFWLTYHLLRRPHVLQREVEARTREIAAEKAALRSEIEARIKAEAYLERSHALLDSIFEHIPGMIVLKRASDMRIARINSSGEQILGRSRDLLKGRCNEEIYAPAVADMLSHGDEQALRAPGPVELPLQCIEMPGAEPRWVLFRKIALRDRDSHAKYILEFGEDLTQRENAERRVANLNRILTVLSEINHLIIFTRDRAQLLERARLVMQEKGGFPAVWIHVRDGEQSEIIADTSIQPHVERIVREIDNPARRCWPKRRLHCQTLDCCSAGIAAELRQLGLQSMFHLPLKSGDIAWGDIGILGPVGRTFATEEQSLLEELAGNLSFALGAIAHDEARRAAERTLELSARVFENNSEGIIITDEANRIVMINKAFTTVTGYTSEEVIGKTPSILNSGRHPPEFFAQMWHTLKETGEWCGEVMNRRKNGEDFPEWLTISQVRDDQGRVTNYVAIFSDLTGRRRIEASLEFLANYDPLTSLPNRDHFSDRLAKSIAEAREEDRRVAVIYFDLDRFKLINESVGQAGGDQLLVEVSSRLVAEAGNKLNVARLGGDQFAILVPGVESVAQATQAVLRLQSRLSKPYLHLFDQELHVSASIGITVYPDDGLDAEVLTRNADSAMYKAIEDGGNTYRFFREDMHQHAAERVQFEAKLHHALERGELSVHFQPFVSGASGRIVGGEALLRWNCPDLGGQISPSTFVPLLEEIGLIRHVGEWVLHRACAEVRRWQSVVEGKLFVAVNISALQLTTDLPRIISEAIAEHGLAPEQLEIELTESAIMRDADHGIRLLDEIKALGVQVSIDDFGTGYSSLSYLKRLPATTLKVDRSFVFDIPEDTEAVSITRAILALGHSLRLNIIAEGVETRDQVEFLCHNGCDILQGHYFAKAVNAEEFMSLLAESPVFELPVNSQRPFQLLSSKRLHGPRLV